MTNLNKKQLAATIILVLYPTLVNYTNLVCVLKYCKKILCFEGLLQFFLDSLYLVAISGQMKPLIENQILNKVIFKELSRC